MTTKKQAKRYKQIIKCYNQRAGRESITNSKYGSYRDIQEQLKCSPNTIQKAFEYKKRAKQTVKARRKKNK